MPTLGLHVHVLRVKICNFVLISFIQTGVRPAIPNQQLTSHPPKINNPPLRLRLNNAVITINKTPRYRLPRTLQHLISPTILCPLLFFPMYYQLQNLKVRYSGCHDYIPGVSKVCMCMYTDQVVILCKFWSLHYIKGTDNFYS